MRSTSGMLGTTRMARCKPKERRFMWGGTVHIMFKHISLWMTRCEEHVRYPKDMSKGYTGKTPVNCIECIASSGNEDE